MKSKKIVCLFLVIIMMFFAFNMNSYAVTLPWFSISSNNYSKGDKITLDENNELGVGETLQLYGMMIYGNEMYDPENPDSVGRFVDETNLNGVTWTSSNEGIAIVDNTGKVTGVAEGKTTIKAEYNGEDEEYEVVVGNIMVIGNNIIIIQKEGKKIITKGDMLQLNIQGVEDLSNIKNDDVTWSSSNENIATVDTKGLVKSVGVGKVTITAEYGSYSSTYEIEVKDENNLEPPVDDDIYDLFSNKEKIEINVESSDKVEITAKVKDGIVMIDEVLMVKDNWDVEWIIEDETIAKCVPEKGIENNKYGGTQVAGRATIQGLKSGTTTLVAKVKVSENRVEEIKIPIKVNNAKKEDNTVADKDLAKTGERNFFIIVGIASVMMLGYFGIKIRK
ncbi:MAG: Ig-like domain-containing protein [Clostridia bacterium]|nr:Ig-like domain-containing protein [Clostridia bacterium]